MHDQSAVVAATLVAPPASLGVTHWSARLLGEHLDISFARVDRIWRQWGLQPWKVETFKFSTDQELEAKIRDLVGLYLDPPEKAVVVCIDEKTQIQALDRTAPILPIRPGVPEKQTDQASEVAQVFASVVDLDRPLTARVSTGFSNARTSGSSQRPA